MIGVHSEDLIFNRLLPSLSPTTLQGRLMLLLQGSHCEDPITTKPALGSTAIIEFINTTPDYHPMHVSALLCNDGFQCCPGAS